MAECDGIRHLNSIAQVYVSVRVRVVILQATDTREQRCKGLGLVWAGLMQAKISSRKHPSSYQPGFKAIAFAVLCR